jgi:hypothetical protein
MALGFTELNRILSDPLMYDTIKMCDYSEKELQKNIKLIERWKKQKKKEIKSITWFFPAFSKPFAGCNTILMLASFFKGKGIKQQFVLFESKKVAEYCRDKLLEGKWGDFKDVKIYINPDIKEIGYSDIAIATRWDTAYPVLKFNKTLGKYYLIQDDERHLFASGSFSALAGLTYTFGFVGITNSLELKDMYKKEFGMPSICFFPAPNKVYKTQRTLPNTKVKKLWFYARTRSDRNGYHLGMVALEEIKRRHPDVEIVLSGEDSNKVKSFEFTDVGVLPTISDLAKLYSECDVGIYLVFSRHTGVIPFDLMASGCITLTNKRPYTVHKLKDKENCIMSEPTPTRIADSFDLLYDDYSLRKKILEKGFETVKGSTLEEELDKVYRTMLS